MVLPHVLNRIFQYSSIFCETSTSYLQIRLHKPLFLDSWTRHSLVRSCLPRSSCCSCNFVFVGSPRVLFPVWVHKSSAVLNSIEFSQFPFNQVRVFLSFAQHFFKRGWPFIRSVLHCSFNSIVMFHFFAPRVPSCGNHTTPSRLHTFIASSLTFTSSCKFHIDLRSRSTCT